LRNAFGGKTEWRGKEGRGLRKAKKLENKERGEKRENYGNRADLESKEGVGCRECLF
jgi:hypothetical protein